uniref:Galectin domain-containing protein n=1 Tax=Globodera pallida TaxID=36090 RepID=A0A183BSS7_GLOPA
MKTSPTRLTGQSINNFTIPIAPLDQCFPYEESKTFGLEFRLPRTGGQCDIGILICYPSTLATHSLDNLHTVNGLSVNSELFNVDNTVNNMWANECKGLLTGNKKIKDKATWHGIEVNTVKKSDGTSVMKLSTSLIGVGNEKSFEIQAFRQFILHFGSKNDFFAYVTVDGGEPIEIAGDKAKREAYKQLAPRGARLKDFVGFWTLGPDMLPWNDHTMRLHVQRDCNCTMEAWFIRPTDTEPVDPKKLSRGSAGTSCTRVNRTETRHIVPLNNTLKADHLILIRVLTNEHFRSVFFELNATDSEQGPLMECYLHTEPDLSSIRLRDSETQDNATTTPIYDLLPKSNNNSQIEFMIVLTGYSYGIVMNGQLLDGLVFFPPKWWKGLPFDNMTSLRVRGSFFLLSEPTVMAFDTIQQNYKLPQIPIPFNQTVDRLGINSFLRFLVKPHDKFTNFNISLLHDRPVEYDEYLGATVLTMQVQPDKIILSTFYKGDTTNSQSFPSVNTQAAMEFKIEVDSNFFIIYKNDTGLVAFPRFLSGWATNFVRVGGDVSLLAPVFYERAEGLIAGYIQNHTVKLKTLLTSEDVIHIVVRIKKSDSFSILLMHESWEWSDKIGDVVLGLSFNSKSPGSNNYTFRCGYYLHHEHGNNDVMLNKVPKMKGHGDPTDLNLNYNGQRFQIAISCNDTASAFLVDIVDGMSPPFHRGPSTIFEFKTKAQAK